MFTFPQQKEKQILYVINEPSRCFPDFTNSSKQ